MRYYVFLAMVALVVGESIPVLDENDRVVQMIDSGLPDEVLVLDENDKPTSQKFSSRKPLSLSDSPSDWPDTTRDLYTVKLFSTFKPDNVAFPVRALPSHTLVKLKKLCNTDLVILHSSHRRQAVSLHRCPNSPTFTSFTWVITSNGHLTIGSCENSLELTNKHWHLAAGKQVFAAGEGRFRLDNMGVLVTVEWNLQSGTFMKDDLLWGSLSSQERTQLTDKVTKAWKYRCPNAEVEFVNVPENTLMHCPEPTLAQLNGLFTYPAPKANTNFGRLHVFLVPMLTREKGETPMDLCQRQEANVVAEGVEVGIKTGTIQVVHKLEEEANKASPVGQIHTVIFVVAWLLVVMPQSIPTPTKWRIVTLGVVSTVLISAVPL